MSRAGEGWSDSRIIKALETSPSMVYRARKQLVEEGVEAVSSRKQRARPTVSRIFDWSLGTMHMTLHEKPPSISIRIQRIPHEGTDLSRI